MHPRGSGSSVARRFVAGLWAGSVLLTGCPAEDGGTGVGGVLVVAQVQIEAGLRDVLIGGTRQLTATPRTSTGIAVPGKTITWSSSANGVATVDASGLVRGVTQGTASIRATVDGVTGQVTVDVRPVPVASVTVVLGATSLVAGETTSAQAAAFDSIGGSLGGRTVAWSSSDQNVATVSAAGIVTAVSAGPVNIIATIEGRSGLAPLTVLPRSAVKLGFIAQPTQTAAGAAISPPVRVAFQDGAGATASTATGTITLAFSANPTGAVLGGTLSAPAVAGVATFPDLQIAKAGQPYSLQASALGVAGATSNSFAVVAGPAAALAIVTAPAGSAASGAPLGVQPVLELRDGLGNVVPQAGVTVTASVASGPGTLSGTVTALTNASGRATFIDLAIIGSVGSYTLQFKAPGLTDAVSSAIAIGAGGATQLTFGAAPPTTAVNAQALAPALRVQLRDGTGNPVAQAGVPVTASLASGNGVLAGTLNAVTAANGEATFADLRFTGVVGNFTIQFASAGLSSAITNPIALVAGAEHAISFLVAPPNTAVNGAALSVAPVVQLRDVSGNAVAKAGVTISVTVQTPVSGVLQGTVVRTTDAQGQVTFPGLSLLGQVGPYTLTFRSGALSEAIANPLQLQPGPATALAFRTPPPAGAQSGVALAPQPAVRVVDQSGNPLGTAGVSVAASLASGPGLLGGTLAATTDGSGDATFGNLVLSGPTGGYTIRFSTAGLPALVSPTVTVGAGAATQVTFTTAPPATAQNGVAVAPAVVVQLRDGVGNPSAQAGVTVTASLSSGPGLLGGTVAAVTNGGGTATFANLVITGTTGAYVLQFAAPGLTTAVANPLTLMPGAASQLTFTTAPPGTATNGLDLSPAIEVQLRDLSGNPVPQAGVSVTAAIATGSGAALSGATSVTTDAAGLATFSTLRLTGTVGSFTLRFSSAGVSSATSNAIALQPGAAAALVVSTQPPPSTASGAVLSPQPVVRLVDQSGNLVASNGVSVTASLASGPGSLGGTLVATTASGVASFTNLSITGTTGTYTIRFSAPGVTSAVSGTIGVGAGAATAIQFVGTPPTTATAGVALSPAIVVRLVDGASNPVAQSGVSVTAVLASGGGTIGGTTAVVTDGTGAASFANLVLTGTVGTYQVRFDVSGFSSITTPSIALGAGAAAKVALTTPPSTTATNGAALATQPVAQLQDASGNAVSQSGTVIIATITSGTGTLANATATTNGAGQATFSGLAITGTAGSFTLQFATGALTPSSAPVTLQAGPAAKLALFQAPATTATSGALLVPQPVVQLQDQSGNPVSSAGVTVSVALATTPGASTLNGVTAVPTAGNGRATFTDLAIAGVTGGYTLAFSAPTLTGVTSGTITLGAGAATQLTFSTAPPASGTNGVDLAPPIVVQARDGSGNPVAQANISVTVALGTNPGGVLSGTSPVITDAGGAATFSDLRITGTAGSYTLSFSASGLSAATSNPIAIAAGPATQMAFTTAPPGTAANGATLAPAPVVQLRDQSGNVVAATGTGVTASLIAGAGGTLGGTTLVNTTSGSASFGNLQITGPVGNYTLRFASPSLPNLDAPAPLALTPGPAAAIGFATAPPGAATSGIALTPQPQVQVRDQSGNPVAQSGLLITATVSAGATVTNATATTDGTGLATFAGLSLTGAAGNYTLDFTGSPYPVLTSSPIALAAGTATQMVFITPPPASAVNGDILAPAVVVELRDASNNPVLVAGTNVTVTRIAGGGVLVGTTTVQTTSNGRATFADLALQGSAPDTYQLRFASSGVPNLDSGNIALAVGSATQLLFQAAPPTSAVNGTTFGSNTVVALGDLTGNLVPTNNVSIVASVASGPGATLGGTKTRLTAGGVATFDDLLLTGTAGGYTLDFTSMGLTKATSNTLTLQAGAATKIVFITQPPASGASGVALTPATVIEVQDASNNPVLQAGTTVSAQVISGTGSVSNASVLTDASGRATFSTLTISGTAGNFTLGFSSGSLTGLLSAPIAIGPGNPAKLAFIVTPSTTATNGAALAQQPVVELRDATDNPVPQAGTGITVAVGTGAGTLTGTQLVVNTLANGRASFAGLTITGPSGPHTLEFSGTGLSTLVSATITVNPGPAHALLMVAQPPGNATSSAAFGSAPSVRLVDSSGNSVAVAGTNVSVALVPSGGGASLGGTATQATDAGGVATFPGLSITGPSGNYQLAFSAGGLVPDTSATIAVTAATKLAVATQPSATTQDDSVFAQQPTVQLQDAGNNPVALANVVVTAAISAGGAGTLLGTLTATTDGTGLATFTDLRIKGVTGVRQLEFTASGLTPATSTSITVTPGDPAAVAMLAQPPATAVSGGGFFSDPSARLVDGSGNPVPTAGTSVTVALVPAGGGATLNGTLTRTTDGSGVALFPGLSITGPGGNYRLAFSSGTLAPDTSSTIAVTAATKLAVTTQPSGSVPNDVDFPQQPQIQLQDASNAPVALAGVVVTAAIGNGAGTLLGTLTATTDASGLATFTNLRIQGVIGARDLDFSAPGLTGITSGTVTITPGTATALAVVTQPQATTVDAEPLTTAPAVKLVDISGNDVDSAGVSIDVAPTPAGATLGGTTNQPTGGTGTATFAGLSVGGTAGTYQLAFSGTGLTGVQSGNVVLTVPDTIVITTPPPANAVDDALLSPQPTVRVDDGGGTALVGVTVTVDLVIVSGAGTLAGTTVLVTGAGGTVSWTDLKIQTSGGTGQFRLRFRTANGTESLSGTIDIP